MKRNVIQSDIVEVTSDALIYSTNVRLALTGGVGAALLKKFGWRVQISLQNCSIGTGRQLAEVGEVIECGIPGSTWRVVFHTVATDEVYRTDEEVVRRILRRCLSRCAETANVRSITTSALGSGYGDLDLARFGIIAKEVSREFESSHIESFSIVTLDPKEAEVLAASFLDAKAN